MSRKFNIGDRVVGEGATMSNRYATDGKCHNAQRGTFNHECGAPATWIGTNGNAFASGFCDWCKEHGDDRHGLRWERRADWEYRLSGAAFRKPVEPAPARPDPEAELRALWTAEGVPVERQNAMIADITAKAQPGAMIGPFQIPATEPTPAGNQYVLPGCEKDKRRGPSQMDLF